MEDDRLESKVIYKNASHLRIRTGIESIPAPPIWSKYSSCAQGAAPFKFGSEGTKGIQVG